MSKKTEVKSTASTTKETVTEEPQTEEEKKRAEDAARIKTQSETDVEIARKRERSIDPEGEIEAE